MPIYMLISFYDETFLQFINLINGKKRATDTKRSKLIKSP